jgi:hypothetical protein
MRISVAETGGMAMGWMMGKTRVWRAAAVVIVGGMLSARAAGEEAAVTVRVSPEQAGRVLPADYLGVSYESERVLPDADGRYYFRADNGPLVQMFKTLGIRSLRVGGNTADRASVKFPEEKDIDQLFAFARAAGVKVIFTMRLKGGSPEASAKTARYIWERHRELLEGFAVGNEPNVFTSDYEVFLKNWKAHEEAILAVAPGAKFCGPAATSGKAAWARDFAKEFAGSGRIAAITYHLYPGGNAFLVTDAAKARAEMLSPKWVEGYGKMAEGFVPTVLEEKLAYRLQEANSYWNGGAKDVSDTHAAAVWALDYLWWWAGRGAAGLNFHTGDTVAKENVNTPCYYALYWSTPGGYEAHPVAYAFKAFAAGFGEGAGKWMPVEITDNQSRVNVTAGGVVMGDGSMLVTVINKEIGATARAVKVTLGGAAFGKAAVMPLISTASDPESKTTTRFGGGAIGEDGNWQGEWTTAPAGRHSFVVPATSAVVLKLTKE